MQQMTILAAINMEDTERWMRVVEYNPTPQGDREVFTVFINVEGAVVAPAGTVDSTVDWPPNESNIDDFAMRAVKVVVDRGDAYLTRK